MMTGDVAVIRRDADIHELERLLLERRVHGVPVVDDEERLVGVISQTDLLAWHHAVGIEGGAYYDYGNLLVPDNEDFRGLQLKDIRTANVGEIMSPVVHCIRPDRPIAVAAARMIERRIHRLIVVDPDMHVMGIISAIDLLRAVPGTDGLIQQVDSSDGRIPAPS
jgi:CBS domain-containing protein